MYMVTNNPYSYTALTTKIINDMATCACETIDAFSELESYLP